MRRVAGGRRPDRVKVRQALLQEARRLLERSEYETALSLVEQAAQLARTQEEREECDSLCAEVYYRRGLDRADEARLEDLKRAVELAPQNVLYRLHLARALEQNGRADEALIHYQAASQLSEAPGVRFLWCVATLEADQPSPVADLPLAERNTLDIVRALVTNRLASAPLTEPVLGDSLPLWRALAQMLTDAKAAPVEELGVVASLLDGTGAAAIARYYQGVAALRAGDLDAAWQALTAAQQAGYRSSWLTENLNALARVRAVRFAETGNWKDVIKVGEPVLRRAADRILAETVGLAYFHLGYAAAQAGDWRVAAHHWQQAANYTNNRYLAQNLALALEHQEDWEGAAQAWHDMVRRRPRNKDHPDYLEDGQVAALWRHAAECYRQADNPAEAVVCLRNGLKYAPDDNDMRLELGIALMANQQFDAAERELQRVLERDPENVEALVHLGYLYIVSGWWYASDKAVEVLKRALELDPSHEEARETLGAIFIRQGNWSMDWGMYESAAEQYRQGLEYLPDHPLLHARLGEVERMRGDNEAAREHLLRAYELEPDRVRTVGLVLHELLHLDAGEVERLLPQIREMPGLLPAFWVDQAIDVLECELEEVWADRFFEEALALVGKEWVEDTRASVLVDIFVKLFAMDGGRSWLGRKYRNRINREVPRSGAKEYINSLIAMLEEHNWDKGERLLGKAQHKARKAGEQKLLERIELAQELLFAEDEDTFFELLDQLLD